MSIFINAGECIIPATTMKKGHLFCCFLLFKPHNGKYESHSVINYIYVSMFIHYMYVCFVYITHNNIISMLLLFFILKCYCCYYYSANIVLLMIKRLLAFFYVLFSSQSTTTILYILYCCIFFVYIFFSIKVVQ